MVKKRRGEMQEKRGNRRNEEKKGG